jgi:hypothetical protein
MAHVTKLETFGLRDSGTARAGSTDSIPAHRTFGPTK